MTANPMPNPTNAYRAVIGVGIELISPRDEALIARIRDLPDRRWDADRRCWRVRSVAANAAPLTALLKDFGFDVEPAVERELARMMAMARTGAAVPARRIERDGDGYAIVASYDPDLINDIKMRVPGRRWDSDAKRWTSGSNAGAVHALRSLATKWDLVMAPDVVGHMDGVLAAAGVAVAASQAEDAEIEVDGLAMTLRPFQRAGVAYALAHPRVLIGDEPGLGKTCQAIATIQARNSYPALVVAPSSLKLNWRHEIRRWVPGRRVSILNGTKASAAALADADIVVVNYDIVAKWLTVLVGHGFRAIVADESHYCKNSKAARTKAVKEIAANIPVRLLLSGTPLTNRPAELAPQLDILGMIQEFGGNFGFLRRYAGAYQDRFGWHFDGSSNLDELHERLRASVMVRRSKTDVITELPDKAYSTVPLDLSNAAEYRRAAAEVTAWIQDGHEEVGEQGAEHLTRINRLRQLSGLGKVRAAIEWATDLMEGGHKLVLFAHHVAVQRALIEAFHGCVSIVDGDSDEQIERNKERFQTDPDCRLIVCSLLKAGVGHTLTAASHVALVELPWTPGEVDQAADRLHRIGQRDSVNVYYLTGEGTIDEWMADLVDSKRRVVSRTLDGERGEAGAARASILAQLVARMAAA